MCAANGHAAGAKENQANVTNLSASPVSLPTPSSPSLVLTPDQIKEFVAALEVPFDTAVIEWRVTNTTRSGSPARGQVIPYADQRAYTDRLNALFTPAGWTRRYAVHTSANFERGQDRKTVAKVFVTCELTIFGLGSHSATGEEWTDNPNAGTAAEAQAFKRTCACFGLGRYLYYFTGIWVDLDDRKRPKTTPQLGGWATPEGWRKGLRPELQAQRKGTTEKPSAMNRNTAPPKSIRTAEHDELIRQIEAMAQPLGKRLYRGVLKSVRAWNPADLRDTAILRKVLASMQAGDQLLNRLMAILEQTGGGPLERVLPSLKLRSLDQVDSLEVLEKIVGTLEAQ